MHGTGSAIRLVARKTFCFDHASSVGETGGSPSFRHGTDFSFLLCEREAKMNFFKRPSSANIPDKILGEQERFLMDRVFVPLSEITTENEACANGPAPIVSTKPAPIDTHEVAPAVEANSDMPLFQHIVPDPHVSTIPGDEASIPSSNASKKTSLFGGKGIVICAMLSLATGIAVGAAWSRTDVTPPDVQNQSAECDCSRPIVPAAEHKRTGSWPGTNTQDTGAASRGPIASPIASCSLAGASKCKTE